MSGASHIEQIELVGDQIEPASEGPSSATTARVVQGHFRQTSRTTPFQVDFELFNEHFLSMRYRRFLRREREYWIDLGMLDPRPQRWIRLDPLSGFASLLLVFVSVVWWWPLKGVLVEWPPYTSVGLALSAAACLACVALVLRSHNAVRLVSHHARVPLVYLLHGRPNRRAVEDFLRDLRSRIALGRRRQSSDTTQTLAFELRELRRLKDATVLPAHQYEHIKSRLLKKH